MKKKDDRSNFYPERREGAFKDPSDLHAIMHQWETIDGSKMKASPGTELLECI